MAMNILTNKSQHGTNTIATQKGMKSAIG